MRIRTLFACLCLLFVSAISPAEEVWGIHSRPILQAVVISDGVRVHAEPRTDALVVGRAWKGVRTKGYEMQAGWVLAEFSNGERGWIRADFLQAVEPEAEEEISPPEAQARMPVGAPAPAEPYRIQVADKVIVKSFQNPEINAEMTVRPDGCISLLLLDDVYAKGLTPAELDRLLTKRYRRHFNDPELTVLVNDIKEVIESRVFVGGEVAIPQELPLQVPLTVLQGIIAAGGFKDTAKPENVIVIRKGKRNQPIMYSLDLANVQEGEAVPDNIVLQPFDIVYVPSTKVANVGKFVDLYINKIMPRFVNVGFSWFRQLPGG